MKTVQMKTFGATLTDRGDGKKAYRQIQRAESGPVALDFSGVMSLGSSFGDEVILKVARQQDNRLTIRSANHVIQNAVRRTVEETDVIISFE
jgi:hypothetical protein